MRSDRVRGKMQVSPRLTPMSKKLGHSPARRNGKRRAGGVFSNIYLCIVLPYTYARRITGLTSGRAGLRNGYMTNRLPWAGDL